jgi:serine/threonine protein kinase
MGATFVASMFTKDSPPIIPVPGVRPAGIYAHMTNRSSDSSWYPAGIYAPMTNRSSASSWYHRSAVDKIVPFVWANHNETSELARRADAIFQCWEKDKPQETTTPWTTYHSGALHSSRGHDPGFLSPESSPPTSDTDSSMGVSRGSGSFRPRSSASSPCSQTSSAGTSPTLPRSIPCTTETKSSAATTDLVPPPPPKTIWRRQDSGIPTDSCWVSLVAHFRLETSVLSSAYQVQAVIGRGCHAEVAAVERGCASPPATTPLVCKRSKRSTGTTRQSRRHRRWRKRHGFSAHRVRELVLLHSVSTWDPTERRSIHDRLGVCPLLDVVVDDCPLASDPTSSVAAKDEEPSPCMILPRFSGTLADHLHHGRHNNWSWPFVAVVVDQISQAIGRLHRKGITHRDLKPRNILVERARPPCFRCKGVDGCRPSPLCAQSWIRCTDHAQALGEFPLVALTDFGSARMMPPTSATADLTRPPGALCLCPAPRSVSAPSGARVAQGTITLPLSRSANPRRRRSTGNTTPLPLHSVPVSIPRHPPPAATPVVTPTTVPLTYPVTTPSYEAPETILVALRTCGPVALARLGVGLPAGQSTPVDHLDKVPLTADPLAGDVWALGILVMEILTGSCVSWDCEISALPPSAISGAVFQRHCALIACLSSDHQSVLQQRLAFFGRGVDQTPGWGIAMSKVDRYCANLQRCVNQKLPPEYHEPLFTALLGLLHPCPSCRWDLPMFLSSRIGEAMHTERLRHSVQGDVD